MTKQEVIERVKQIEAIRHDDEVAHSMEDDLYRDVLRAIAGGEIDGHELAAEALKVEKIKFARWCA